MDSAEFTIKLCRATNFYTVIKSNIKAHYSASDIHRRSLSFDRKSKSNSVINYCYSEKETNNSEDRFQKKFELGESLSPEKTDFYNRNSPNASQRTIIFNDSLDPIVAGESKHGPSLITSDIYANLDKEQSFMSTLVSVAVANVDSQIPYEQKSTVDMASNETLMYRENLDSDDTLMNTTLSSTSSTSSIDTNAHGIKRNVGKLLISEITDFESNETINNKNINDMEDPYGSRDTLVASKTNASEIKYNDEMSYKDSMSFDSSQMNNPLVYNINNKNKLNNLSVNRKNLLDTVINMGIYPNMTNSTHQTHSDVIVTIPGNKITTFSSEIHMERKETETNLPGSVLNKPYVIEPKPVPKSIHLPDGSAINKLIEEGGKTLKRTCADELKNAQPTTITELWERIVMVLDLAVRRLEESISEKISRELQNALSMFETYKQNIKSTANKVSYGKLGREISMRFREDTGVQCVLVETCIIDALTIRSALTSTTKSHKDELPVSTKSFLDTTEHKIIDHFTDILKPSLIKPFTIETQTTISIEDSRRADMKFLIRNRGFVKPILTITSVPIRFFKENIFVIVSVPLFLLTLLMIYGCIVLIMDF